MNLVDAIRIASQQRLHPAPEEQASTGGAAAFASQAEEGEGIQTVRFEVRLNSQQLYDLLQWLARNLHPVMTLREAAHYLRLRPMELQALAENGAIPAFKVDGKWRFLKSALDEWILAQRAAEFIVKEEETNVA
jgi:excisionase family DNA binding protein